MCTKDILTAFIQGELVTSHTLKSIEENESLLENGIIDSLAIIKLLTFIEKKICV